MTVILFGYVAVVTLWLTLFIIHRRAPAVWHQAHRATWWLLAASVMIAVAWFLGSIWLSFFGMLAALTSVSFIFQVLTDWLKKQRVSRAAILVWFEWLLVFSITIAHVWVWAIGILYESAH